jgi:aminoglycoside 3-N-acetyltransferase
MVHRRVANQDLVDLGAPNGATVMVHTSLRALGYVVGGEQAVIEALRTAVGPTGTRVMPAQSWQLCDPAFLNESDLPQEWWPTIRNHLPAYDAA